MKIAMVDPSLFTLPYDHHLCRALHRRGNGVVLFTRALRPEEPRLDFEYWKTDGFYPLSERLRGRSMPPQVWLAMKGAEHLGGMASLLAVLARLRPDAIHFQWLPVPVVDGVFLKVLRQLAPIVLTVHDSRGLLNPTSGLQLAGWFKILAGLDRLVVHLEASKTELVSAGLDPAKIVVVPHGVLSYDEGGGEAEAPEPPADPARPTRVLAFGAIKPYKALDLLIEALPLMPEAARERTRLVVVGEPHVPVDELKELARTRGVDHLVEWDLRYVPDEEVPSIIRASDVVAFPYRRIDASGVLMLTLPFAKPIVATRVGCFQELLKDGETARLVPPEDPAALAAALADVVDDPEGGKTLGRNARDLALGALSWEAIAETTEALYRDARLGRGFRP